MPVDRHKNYKALLEALKNPKSKKQIHALTEAALRELYQQIFPGKKMPGIEKIKSEIEKVHPRDRRKNEHIKIAYNCAFLHTESNLRSAYLWPWRNPWKFTFVIAAIIISGASFGLAAPAAIPAAISALGAGNIIGAALAR